MQQVDVSSGFPKNERVNLRLDAFTKGLLEQAATIDHRSLTGFILDAARQQAEKLMEKQRAIRLNKDEWDRFIDAMNHPKKPNASLLKAAKKYKAMNIKSDD